MGRVVAVGHANFDILVYVDMLPREDDSVMASSAYFSPGGSAANFACAASKLGLSSSFIGRVGNDPLGEMVLSNLKAHGVDVSEVKVDPELPTGIVVVIVGSEGARRMIRFRGANSRLSLEDIDPDYLSKHEILHVSGVSTSLAKGLARICRRLGLKLSYDPGSVACRGGLRGDLVEVLRSTDFLFLNRLELRLLTGEEVTAGLKRLESICSGVIVVKMGDKGSVVSYGGVQLEIPPFKAGPPVDTTGAGDVFAAAFLSAIARGYELRRAGLYASIAAGIKVTHPTSTGGIPSSKEVERLLKELESTGG